MTGIRRIGRRRWLAAVPLAIGAVAMQLVNVMAAAFVGVGTVAGVVAFNGAGVPPVLNACSGTGFSFDSNTVPINPGVAPPGGWTNAAVITIQGSAYPGPVHIWANGVGSDCVSQGFGTLTVGAFGQLPQPSGASLSCGVSGQYYRVGPAVVVAATGPCTVNTVSGSMVFLASGVLIPTQGNGVTSNITQAEWGGVWTGVAF